MPRLRDRVGILARLICLGLLAAGCGGESDEDAIRATIQRGVEAAEAGDLKALAELVSEDYSDSQGRDKPGLVGQLAFTMQGRDVHVWHKIQSIEIDGRSAESMSVAALAGRPVNREDLLDGAEAELGRMALSWVHERGRWRVRSAVWAPVPIEEMF